MKIGKYDIIRKIGYTGKCDVYRARVDGKAVVIKRGIIPEQENSFRRAKHVLRSLDHPNIVKFVDDGFDGDIPYIVMEDGGTSWSDCRRKRSGLFEIRPIPLKKAFHVGLELARVVAYIHEQGWMHSDIITKNIGWNEGTKVFDFDAARETDRFECEEQQLRYVLHSLIRFGRTLDEMSALFERRKPLRTAFDAIYDSRFTSATIRDILEEECNAI